MTIGRGCPLSSGLIIGKTNAGADLRRPPASQQTSQAPPLDLFAWVTCQDVEEG